MASVSLRISGMTCASCVARVERRLNRLDGVEATVNLASEQAAVSFDPSRVDISGLIAAVESAGYLASAPQAERERDAAPSYRWRLLLSLPLAIPVALFAWFGALRPSGWEWVSLALATPVVFVGGWPFHRGAARNLRHGAATMDSLISLGTLAAWAWSTVVLAAGLSVGVVFDAAAMITVLILLGRHLEAGVRRKARDAVSSLVQLGAKEARVLRGGAEILVQIDRLRVGDRFVVRPGDKVATDGVVVEGRSTLDASLLTGEPIPVEVAPGDEVTGATLNQSGRIVVEATRVGSETALAQIARLVAEAQAGKGEVQRLADRVSAVFVPLVVAVAVSTLGGWLLAGSSAAFAFAAAVAAVVIACPCALGLATPTALMVGAGRAAQLGIVIKGPEVLERTRRVSTVVLDKTGTLTDARMSVVELLPAEGVAESELLRLAAAAEAGSEHPVGRAIADLGRRRLGTLAPLDGFSARPGLGVEAVVEASAVLVGGRRLVGAASSASSDRGRLAKEWDRLETEAATVVGVAVDGELLGLVAVADRVKPTSARAVEALAALGLKPVVLTGDSPQAAAAVGRAVGIERVFAGLLPSEKAAEVARLQADGEVVAFVGDGINDAPALARADLGIAIGTGADVAVEASDLTLVSGDLMAAVDAVRLSRRMLRTIKQNLFWAFAYNVAAIPLAVSGIVDPIVAAAAMAFSSLFVVANSLRLRRFAPAWAGS